MSTLKETILNVYHHKPTDHPAVINDVNIVMPIPGMEATMDPNGSYDMWGTHWTFEPSLMAFMPTPGITAFDDITQWREHTTIPDLDAVDFKAYADQVLPTLDPNKATMFFTFPGLFERLHSLMGVENTLCALLEEPEACAEFFEAVADFKIKYIQKMAQYFPIDIVRMTDDYGTSHGPFMSVPTWRALIKPQLKRIVDACHELGIIYRQHTDGVTIPFMDDFVEIGIDAVDPWQACNKDIRACKVKYQDKIVFVNGFDNQGFLDKSGITEEEMEAEIMRTLNVMVPGGGYLAELEVLDKSKLEIFRRCVDEYNAKHSGSIV